ncbi:MAG TPA: sugar transferase, partial [Candidatus Binataceae bacterium]|nr:sugar transferase [Candidatus Binataceae bacterium]
VGRYTVDDVGAGRYLVSLETVPQDVGPLAVKRAMDVIGALIGLVPCGVVYLWYALRLRRESPGPVFISQQRTGRNGRPFRCHKFRTTAVDAGRQQKELSPRSKFGAVFGRLEDDPRILRSGAWMRRHYLDELPQFWNVLRGDMSLVGPRPSLVIEATSYIDRQRRRLSMKPGITGLFQINGRQAVDDFERVVELDCAYIDNWSLLLDLKIMLKTVGKIFKAEAS